MSGALKRADLKVIEGDARVSDMRLGERLGFQRARKVREIIERNSDELKTYGTIALRRGDVSIGSGAKREVTEYLLNEEQALLICMLARTAKAAAIRKEVITVFMGWRRGDVLPAVPERDAFSVTRERVETVAATLAALDGVTTLARRVTHLPVWRNGRRPGFWSDIEVRTFLTAMHRQVTIAEARAASIERYGPERTPSQSSLHRYWMALDQVSGPMVKRVAE